MGTMGARRETVQGHSSITEKKEREHNTFTKVSMLLALPTMLSERTWVTPMVIALPFAGQQLDAEHKQHLS